MRDTEVLRSRLWATIGLPLATSVWLTACGGSEPAQPKPVGKKGGDAGEAADKAEPAKPNDGKPAQPSEAKAEPKPLPPGTKAYVPPATIDAIPEGEFDYFGPGRDPYGEHEEEEGCPNGDWCGSPEDAAKFGLTGLPDQMSCPAKLAANPEAAEKEDQKADKWKGFSFHPMMQGRLMTSVTTEKRTETGDQNLCCYHWFDYCSGRPLFDGEVQQLAELVPASPSSTWPALEEPGAMIDLASSVAETNLRKLVAARWLEDARMEHASIAAFARAMLELMAMGAPPDLLLGAAEAGADEVEHARLCLGVAAKLDGRAFEPSPLPGLPSRVQGPSEADWIRFARDTFVEGCVGETIATLIATRAARVCEDPLSRSVLERIAADETRHAALAWRTIAWVLEVSGEARVPVELALLELAGVMYEAAQRDGSEGHLPDADPLAEQLAAWGRLDRRAEQLARRDAWVELIAPTLDRVLARPAPSFPTRPRTWA